MSAEVVTPRLTVVVPCYNERANVAPMVASLDHALDGVAWEVVFVDDDSPDGTAAAARAIAQADARVRCIRRVGRRGLYSAVIEGALSSSADYIAVIDGDLQPAETRLPLMLAVIGGDATPEARAFHVADVLDRVLEIDQHLRATRLSLNEVLGPYALVHDGPVRDFHALILDEAGLHP